MLTSAVIIRQAYIRIGAWLGDPSELNAQYNADANFEQIVSEAFPPQSMWDLLTGVENEMATAVASSEDNVLRSVLQDIASVTSGDLIPTTGNNGGSIIGMWGQVRQASTGIELTEGMHQDEIRAIVNGPSGLFKSTLYSYVTVAPRIYATVTSLEIDVCTFNYVTRAAAIAANGNLLFQQAQNCYLDGLMSNLSNEDPNYIALANLHKPMYMEWLASQQPKAMVAA